MPILEFDIGIYIKNAMFLCITGAKVRGEIYEAFDNIYPILKGFKKQWWWCVQTVQWDCAIIFEIVKSDVSWSCA